jgi:hypothetical protein
LEDANAFRNRLSWLRPSSPPAITEPSLFFPSFLGFFSLHSRPKLSFGENIELSKTTEKMWDFQYLLPADRLLFDSNLGKHNIRLFSILSSRATADKNKFLE